MRKREHSSKKRIRKNRGDRVFRAVCVTIVALLVFIVLLPLMNIIASSFSASSAVNSGKVLLWPVDFTLDNYRAILKYKSVWIGYRNTIFYTVVGTMINLVLTMFCAYPLSQKRFAGRRPVNMILFFTMIFSGGMIPNYILMRDLGLMNTVWAVLLPGAVSVYNVMITRNYIESTIPTELEESSRIDGCSPAGYFIHFIMPLSKTIIAVIAMYYAVAHWNSYFNAFMYLTDRELYPLQLFLRTILLESKFDSSIIDDPETARALQGLAQTLKYVVIVVSTLPLMCIYPFVQKYFVKGVMIGSVKG